MILDGERLDVLNESGLVILQRPGSFCFGTDSVLLADFAAPRPGERVADLGAGTGILSILMAAYRPGTQYDAFEIQPDMADMAARSVALNGMEARISVHAMDMRHAPRAVGHGRFALAVCNPPYSKAGSALPSRRADQRLARHEGDIDIHEICASAAALIKNGGRFALIFPAPRLFELMQALDANRLAPKRVRAVHSMADKAPKHMLIDAVKGGGSQLDWLPPLILNDAGGAPSAEWKRIYRVE